FPAVGEADAAVVAPVAGRVEEPDANGAPRRAVESGETVSVAGGPDAAVSPAAGEADAAPAVRVETAGPAFPDAAVVAVAPSMRRDAAAVVPETAAEPDAGRRVLPPADRSAGALRDAGAPSGGPAVLVVPRPEDAAVEMVVFVDGVRQGVAPVRVELPAGEHELRFEAAGRQSLSIVRLRAGERRTVVPRQLLRQLSSP
ncbi:MAG: PEGA domain-containing protein, partial [Myxococcales bacterium]|nr:PEGA domain-containing protein [Myxococcales bacterium]